MCQRKYVQIWSQIHSYTTGGALRQKHTHTVWHILFPCLLWAYRPMNCDQRKQELNSSSNEGGWGPQSCLRNTWNTCTTMSLLHSPFWAVYLDTGKGQGLVYISLCTKGKSHRPWTWGCVTTLCVCSTLCVTLSVFPSFLRINLELRIKLSYSSLYMNTDINRKAEE